MILYGFFYLYGGLKYQIYKLFINITNDTELQRQGLNLILNKTITLKEALCGFYLDLKYITGKILLEKYTKLIICIRINGY